MKTKLWFCVLFCTLLSQVVMAQVHLAGSVSAANSQQKLVAASVSLRGTKYRAQTDANGTFHFNQVPAGKYEVQVSFLGYKLYVEPVDLNQDTRLEVQLQPLAIIGEEVIVRGTRAQKDAPATFINMDKAEIEKNNSGQDLPFVLQNTPGVVVNSDAGAGVGYTAMRIRGSDAQRTNITINGIPYNDSESAGSYFVNMPDFTSSINSIQIQRGVGTSTNGAGAFGASVNIQTAGEPEPVPTVEVNNTIGSYKTLKNTVRVASGLVNERFSFDARLSQIQSDGYIDRASSDLKSFFLSGAFHGEKDLIRVNVFSGKEKTYQAWYGLEWPSENGDPSRALNDKMLRRQNVYTYPNQTDNYTQTHYQLLYNREITSALSFNAALHYTRGAGYYEEYKSKQSLLDYGLGQEDWRNTPKDISDIIRQRWLDNNFYGGTYNFTYKPLAALMLTLGGAYNEYKGGHYGDVIWAQSYPSDLSNANYHRYYNNAANKNESNTYLKADYSLSQHWLLFVDLQYRHIFYKIAGPDENFRNLNASYQWNFFNPKAGLTYKINAQQNMYLSYGQANREPIRSDIVEAQGQLPTAERLHDFEFGYRLGKKSYALQANIYGMFYQNQLVESGKLNDVGSSIRENVPQSYRIGIELNGGVQFCEPLRLNANVALSRNKIRSYTQYLSYDYNSKPAIPITFRNTDIAFSPNVVAFAEWVYTPFEGFEMAWQNKFVAQQYLDNTSNTDRSSYLAAGIMDNRYRKIPAYYISNLRLGYDFSVRGVKNIHIGCLVNNIFNKLYVANGYTYSGLYEDNPQDGFYSATGFYPQATTNFLLSLNLKF